MRQPTYVLAIDPALSTTGYAIIDRDTCELVHVDKITTSPKDSNDDRILSLLTELTQVAEKYWISNVVLEDGFSGPNQKTAQQLATLRGAIIGLFRFRQYSVSHMQPTQIRKALGCGGDAKKVSWCLDTKSLNQFSYSACACPSSEEENQCVSPGATHSPSGVKTASYFGVHCSCVLS